MDGQQEMQYERMGWHWMRTEITWLGKIKWVGMAEMGWETIYIYETGWEKMRGDWTQGRI